MKKHLLVFAVVASAFAMLTSCTTLNHSMREPYSNVEFVKGDFDFSEQVTAEAQSTLILGIDWNRLFDKKSGTVSRNSVSIPVVGGFIGDRTSDYALFNLMTANPGYDVVFYPQYEKKVEKPVLGLGFITKKVTVKTTARLGKLRQSSDMDMLKKRLKVSSEKQ